MLGDNSLLNVKLLEGFVLSLIIFEKVLLCLYNTRLGPIFDGLGLVTVSVSQLV